MPTTVLDRYGKPFATNEVRKRIGFLGGDYLPVDSGGECHAPSVERRETAFARETTEGSWEAPECREKAVVNTRREGDV